MPERPPRGSLTCGAYVERSRVAPARGRPTTGCCRPHTNRSKSNNQQSKNASSTKPPPQIKSSNNLNKVRGLPRQNRKLKSKWGLVTHQLNKPNSSQRKEHATEGNSWHQECYNHVNNPEATLYEVGVTATSEVDVKLLADLFVAC